MRVPEIFKNAPFILIVVFLTVPAIIPLLNQGFIVTDDGGWMIIRLSAFYDTLRDGQIPARFLERLNFGYGYPVSNFLYPGYLYLGSLIHLIGFGFIDTVKILFGLSLIFSGVFSYLWLRRLFGRVDSAVGSLIYVYSPYHLFDIYKRGSLGEALSISVLPLVFYGIEKGSTILIALSVFSILIFHNSLAVLFLPLIPIYALLRKSFLRSLPGIILGGLLSSFFTIPAIFELKYTKFFETLISNPLEYFAQVSLIGVVSFVIFTAVALLTFIIYREDFKKVPYRSLLIFFSIIFIISIFLSTNISTFFWENVNASFIQFPFRMLSLSIVAVSFFASYISYILFKKIKVVAVIIMLCLLAFSGYKYLSDQKYSNNPDEFYSTNEATTTVHGEYMPVWVKSPPTSRPENKVEIISGDAEISDLIVSSNKIEFQTRVNSDSIIRLNTIFWPGWKVFVEGEEREINYDNELGVIEFNLKQYDDRVYIFFQDDLIRTLSNTLSLIAALVLVYFISRPIIKF